MKLNTTGNMQVNGFKRSLGTGVMKLNLLDANDRASPEYHLGIKEKNYWKKLSHGQKKGFLKRAGVQTEDDTSTFSVPSGRSFSGTYTVDHGRKQSSMKPTVHETYSHETGSYETVSPEADREFPGVLKDRECFSRLPGMEKGRKDA